MRTRLLREVSPREIRPLLDEEAALWEAELGWDFAEVRAAVAGGVERGTLPGRVLTDGVARRRLLLLHGGRVPGHRRLDLRRARAAAAEASRSSSSTR